MTPKTPCFICEKCQSYLSLDKTIKHGISLIKSEEAVCNVCLNLWQPNSPLLEDALQKACKTYGGLSRNCFSKNNITVSIAGEIYSRFKHHKGRKQSYIQDLKHFLTTQIKRKLPSKDDQPPTLSTPDNQDEEQGYLALHLLCVPPKDMTPSSASLHTSSGKKKQRRQRQRPFVTQGGDPKVNLEQSLKENGYQWQSIANAESDWEKSKNVRITETKKIEYHVAAFRRPIYIYGYYTKHRRDVSQSPFVVMKEIEIKTTANEPDAKRRKKKAETLGVTSVEEQISGPIIKLLGVSTQNNVIGSNTKYGMCKFHASGREDMDVRMLLRPNTIGRPFCIQLIDALRPLETQEQLYDVGKRINNADSNNKGQTSPLWHGQNPMGVGVAEEKLTVINAKAYSNLQADTESKVKHYGCYCWSDRKLPPGDDITSKIFSSLKLPLTIEQKTPLRVVHRRANITRERKILQVTARRKNDHYFRLEISTQAGTYVKEFVHGDMRRTSPSIASLIGCKTNILELDCEGIELGGK
jgi:tRNA pseudouridine(54/55) synthase